MLREPKEILAAFAGTLLADAAVDVVPIDRSEHPRIDLTANGEFNAFAVWQVARERLAETGRWPIVARTDKGPGEPSLGRQILDLADSDGGQLVDRLRRSRSSLRSHALEDDWIRKHLANLEPATAPRPTVEQVRADFGAGLTGTDLDRWLLDWEHGHGLQPDGYVSDMWRALHLDTSTTQVNPTVSLLPTSDGWKVPSLLNWFEFSAVRSPEPLASLVAALRLFHDRFAAEVWYYGGVEMHFVVGSPPATLADAFDLALFHEEIAGDGMAVFGPCNHRVHARELIDSNRWVLWAKP